MKKLSNVVFVLILIIALLCFGIYALKIIRAENGAKPVISIEGEEITISVKDGADALLRGVSAFDNEDGDVTDLIVVESFSEFDADMKRSVVYVGFDSDGNVTRASRKISYSDYVSPEFDISEQINVTSWDDNAIISKVKATDCLDGDISSKIMISSYEQMDSTLGLYYVNFEVKNSAGDVSTASAAVVYNNISKNLPVITLKRNIVVVEKGSALDPSDYLEGVEYPVGKGDGTVIVKGSVDTSVPGSYIVEYSATSSNGFTGYAYLTVIVR